MAGKGSTPRPIPDRKRYSENWDRIKWGTIDDKINALPEDRQERIRERAEELREQS